MSLVALHHLRNVQASALDHRHLFTSLTMSLSFWLGLGLRSCAASCALLVVSVVSESLYYQGLRWLERLGIIERLAPQIKTTQTSYQVQTG